MSIIGMSVFKDDPSNSCYTITQFFITNYNLTECEDFTTSTL